MQKGAAALCQDQPMKHRAEWPEKPQMWLTEASIQNPVPTVIAVLSSQKQSLAVSENGLACFSHYAWLQLGLQLSLWSMVLILTDH